MGILALAEREQRRRVHRAALATFGPISSKSYVRDGTYSSSTRSTTVVQGIASTVVLLYESYDSTSTSTVLYELITWDITR